MTVLGNIFGMVEAVSVSPATQRPRRVPRAIEKYLSNPGYARNLQANPQVRVKVGRRWYNGTATFLPDDDGWRRREEIDERNGLMGKVDGKIFRASATNPVTVRVDLGRTSAAE
jgi:hypothetical protein